MRISLCRQYLKMTLANGIPWMHVGNCSWFFLGKACNNHTENRFTIHTIENSKLGFQTTMYCFWHGRILFSLISWSRWKEECTPPTHTTIKYNNNRGVVPTRIDTQQVHCSFIGLDCLFGQKPQRKEADISLEIKISKHDWRGKQLVETTYGPGRMDCKNA